METSLCRAPRSTGTVEQDRSTPTSSLRHPRPADRLSMMSTPTPGGDVPIRRLDRILAFMSLGLLLLSIVCFFAIMIGSAAGVDFSGGLWPVIGLIVYIAPILAFVLLVTVLIMTFVRRARANRGG